MSRHNLIASLMVSCALLVAVWTVLAHRSRGAYKSYDLTPEDFVNFQPSMGGWDIQKLPVAGQDDVDANIVAFSLTRDASASSSLRPSPSALGSPSSPRFVVRLVHGYNMPMCMKIKYYTVEKIQDHRVRPISDPKLQSAFRSLGQEWPQAPSSFGDLSRKTNVIAVNRTHFPLPTSYPLPVQLWRLTSSVGTVSIWATTMIRGDDFSPTVEDICSMSFPRVDTPDDPNWVPRGLAWEDLRHPGVAVRRWYRARWDAARWDIWAMLRLRPRARPSEELLSFITLVENEEEGGLAPEVAREICEIHAVMLNEFHVWGGVNCRL